MNLLRRIFLVLSVCLIIIAGFAPGALAQDSGADDEGQLDPATTNPESPNAITLPDSGSTSSAGTAWAVTNTGTGRAGLFVIDNISSANPALQGSTESAGANAVGVYGAVLAPAPRSGAAGVKGVILGTNANGYGVYGQHRGAGAGVYGQALGAEGRGVLGVNTAGSGSGKGVQGESSAPSGYGGYFLNTGTGGTSRGVYGEARSTGGYGVHGSSPNVGVRGDGQSVGVRGVGGTYGVYGSGTTYALYGQGGAYGVYGYGSNYGVFGSGQTSGVEGHGNTHGVYGQGNTTGVHGQGGTYGVYAVGSTGVRATGTNWGVWTNGNQYGLYAEGGTYGVGGFGTNTGVLGQAPTFGLRGLSPNSIGAQGEGKWGVVGRGSYIGVYAEGASWGILGVNNANVAIEGQGKWGSIGKGSYIGVYGETRTDSAEAYAVYGWTRYPSAWAGYFGGDVNVTGSVYGRMSVTRIENPLDKSKDVVQAQVISPEQIGIQTGNATLDAKGEALVTLPEWFDKVYGDYRYTITPIGGFAPLYVAEELKAGQFKLAGGKPGMKVSWQVSAVRQDKYAKENPLERLALKNDDPARLAGPEAELAAPPQALDSEPGQPAGN